MNHNHYLGFTVSLFLVSLTSYGAALKVTSNSIKNGKMMDMAQVYNSFGCTGSNQSPDLAWTGAPKETKAFAVTMYDPDAPTGSGFWHWTLINLPANVTSLPAGANLSSGAFPSPAIETRTDFGKPGYGGPCPPPGKPHRYIFRVFALKDSIPLDPEASAAMVGFYTNQLKLAEGKIEAKFGR